MFTTEDAMGITILHLCTALSDSVPDSLHIEPECTRRHVDVASVQNRSPFFIHFLVLRLAWYKVDLNHSTVPVIFGYI